MFSIIPLRLYVYGVVVLTLFLSGFGVGYHLVTKRFNAYKAEVMAQSLAQQKLNEATTIKYKQATTEAKYEADRRITAVHSLYNRLYPPTSSNGLSKAGETSSQSDVYSPNNLPPTSKLAEDCAITTVNLLTLQEWAGKVTE
jgi:hypothetical protein